MPVFEHRGEPLLPRRAFALRLARFGGLALLIILGSLGIGILGYHTFEGLGWVDATLNAAMILGGMGPVNELHTRNGKLFAACYALLSGVVFLVAVGVFLAPIVHRFFHHFHLELGTEDPAEESQR